jgi:outer membrane protein OmpA-like peptidoglycan-associated protein
MMSLRFLFLVFCISLLYPLGALGQCDEEVPDKIRALVDKAKDRKKYSKDKRLHFLREALEDEPEYAEANFLLAMEQLRTAESTGQGYAAVLPYLEKAAANCPTLHADIFYFLGQLYFGKHDFVKAADNLELFINFRVDNPSQISKKYPQQIERAKADFKYAAFYRDIFNNPKPFNPKIVYRVSTDKADEYLPFLTPDNEQLYFTRRWQDNTPDKNSIAQTDKVRYIEKFVRAQWQGSDFDEGVPMEPPFNKDPDMNYGGVTVSLDNKQLYITICKPYISKYDGQRRTNCDIYGAHYVHGVNSRNGAEEWHWTEPLNLGPNVNTPDGWESQPSLSADGKHLYFSSWREGSEKIDIYVTEKQADGSWGEAKNLGKPINSAENDKAPFIHSDSKTLYFASQGHTGLGGFDVYYARQRADGTWEAPVNIGHPINTDEDEHGFVVSTDGKTVYYASNHLGEKRTKLNILSFELYKEARPEKVVLIKGKVPAENVALGRAKVEIKNMRTKEINTFDVDSNDGTYAAIVTVKPQDKVLLKVEGEGIAYNSRVVEVPAEKELDERPSGPVTQKIDMPVAREEEGAAYRLEDIHYETNSAEISLRSKLVLDDFAVYLQKRDKLKVAIFGHTDNVGRSAENLTLSTDRAFSVKAYLESKGVAAARLTFKGYGDTRPVESNLTEEGRAKNRRTEFMILSME